MPASAASLLDRRHRRTTFGVVLVVTVIALEAMAVATVLPATVRSLHGMTLYSWSFTAFFIAYVIGLVDAGTRTDRYGPRMPLITGLALFAVGLLVAGSAPIMPVFIAGRAVQGFGGAWAIVAVYVLIGDAFDEALRPKVFAALSAAWVLPALVGPVAAGAVAHLFSWRAVFLGLVPVAAAGAVILIPALRQAHGPAGAPTPVVPAPVVPAPVVPAPAVPGPAVGPDAAGRVGRGRWRRLRPGRTGYGVMLAAGLAIAQSGGARPDWWSLPLLAVGAALAVPGLRGMLPPGALRLRRGLPATISYRGIMTALFASVEAYVPLTLVQLRGFTPLTAGIPLTASAFGWSTASFLQGRRRPGLPRAPLVRRGLVLVAVADAGLALIVSPYVSPWLSVGLWAIGGFGMGFAFPTLSVLMLALSPDAERGTNSAALQISDAVGSIVGIGLGGTVLAFARMGGGSIAPGIVIIDLMMAALAVGAALVWTRVAGEVPAVPRESAAEPPGTGGQRTVQPVQT